MLLFRCLLYFILMIFLVVDCYLILKFIEFVFCANILRQPPMVASNDNLRKKVISEINEHYKKAKNICDFGSGFGGLARCIAKNTKANVYALENMPFSAFVSKFADFFNNTKSKTIWCDAFKYIDETNIKFDVVVAYLGPDTIQKLLKYKNKMSVLVSLDFKLKNVKPVRTIKVGNGATRYSGKLYPNVLYIYEFK